MAGYGAYVKIEGFGFLPITCFSLALATYISQNVGAGKMDRVRKGANFGILTAMIIAEVIGVLIFLGVITSYSIHYTKLYEIITPVPMKSYLALGRCMQPAVSLQRI